LKIQTDLTAAKVEDLQGKRTADKAAESAKQEALTASKQATLDVINKLITPEGTLVPGAAKIVGTSKIMPGLPGILGGSGVLPGGIAQYWSGSEAANASAALARVKARMVVDLIADMKAQSKTGATGFGQLSDKERLILEDSAAMLRTSQSDEAVTQELIRIRDLLKKALLPPTTSTGPARKYMATVE